MPCYQEQSAAGYVPKTHAWQHLRDHFDGTRIEDLTARARTYPGYLRPDIYQTLAARLGEMNSQMFGISLRHEGFQSIATQITALFVQPSGMEGADFAICPVRTESIDVGEDTQVMVSDRALWIVEGNAGIRASVFFALHRPIQGSPTVSVQVAFQPSPVNAAFCDDLLASIAHAIENTRYYRGKVLSFDQTERFGGQAAGITVHRLSKVAKQEVILSKATSDALNQHVFDFASSRKALGILGQSLQKGILLYGPPGTGKTHTIRYLISNLEGHTTFLITAAQVGNLREYVEMARLLQPSIIVIEDVDLIGRERTQMREAKEEALLNRLLNEMDGLTPSAQILFVLTTNRPGEIEEAIASRPGRIDRAIEVPAPDAECRRRLFELYGRCLDVSDDVLDSAVAQTEGVSAAFVRELVRRLAQQGIMRGDPGRVSMLDLERVVGEIRSIDGTLGRTLLGGDIGRPRDDVKRAPPGGTC